MQLSEAIRLGAMLKPQAFGIQFDGLGTCANGAALDAHRALRGFCDIATYCPLTAKEATTCPVCGVRSDTCAETIGGLIAHLNDDHRWTRERIADWVESVEVALSTTSNGTPDCDAVPARPTTEMNACSRQDTVLVSEQV